MRHCHANAGAPAHERLTHANKARSGGAGPLPLALYLLNKLKPLSKCFCYLAVHQLPANGHVTAA